MKLPQGITGFSLHKEELPLVDEKRFRTRCHAAAIEFKGTVSTVEAPWRSGAGNYLISGLRLREGNRLIALNAHFPYIAFVESTVSCTESLRFVEWEEGAAFFGGFGDYQILTPTELSTPLDQADIALLHDVEVKQITYWKAETLGEVVFNLWD